MSQPVSIGPKIPPHKWRDVHRHEVNPVGLKSAEELRQALLEEFKDLVDQGLLALPTPDRKMKERD
jgi:hypothetical protein